MIWIYRLCIVLLSGTIYNVWFFRFNKATAYRGGEASTLKEEFIVYGLEGPMIYLIGGVKLLACALLLLGLRFKALVRPSAITLIILMLGALAMHAKVGDPLMRSLPAALLLGLGSTIFYLDRKV